MPYVLASPSDTVSVNENAVCAVACRRSLICVLVLGDGISNCRDIVHFSNMRLQFKPLRPSRSKTWLIVDGRCIVRYDPNIISMGHLSYSAGSDLAAHPSHYDSCERMQPVSGDDHRCTNSPLPCKPMHEQHAVDTGDEHTCSFDAIPTCTARLCMAIMQHDKATSCKMMSAGQ